MKILLTHRLLEGKPSWHMIMLISKYLNTNYFDVVNTASHFKRSSFYRVMQTQNTRNLKLKWIVSAHVHSPEVGRVNEEIDTDQVTGEDLTISFNPTYLIDSLAAKQRKGRPLAYLSCSSIYLVPKWDITRDQAAHHPSSYKLSEKRLSSSSPLYDIIRKRKGE